MPNILKREIYDLLPLLRVIRGICSIGIVLLLSYYLFVLVMTATGKIV